MSDLPRRIHSEKRTPAEKAITNAMIAVEEAGGDPLLTEAVSLLSTARDKVSDFVDRELAKGKSEPKRITQTVVLNTRSGHFVAMAEILPFNTRPKAVFWGVRLFLDTGLEDSGGRPVYAEDFVASAIPDGS